jgi:ribonuclease HII
VILHSKFKRREVYSKINDSKQLTKIQRNWIFEELVFAQKQGEVAFHTAYIWPDSIDRLGIKEANRQAMELAIHEVLEKVFITT